MAFRSEGAVRAASATSSSCVSERALLLVRTAIFLWCFGLLTYSSFYEGPNCLRFFTVWNFIALTAFFGLGTALSCSCCRHLAEHGPVMPDHRIAAATHKVLLELNLPMSVLIAVVVWLVIYPNDAAIAERTGDTTELRRDLSLTSLSMHGANVLFMTLEFFLDALLVAPRHLGLVVSWAMLYGLFNGLQAYWTGDAVYFFMDFTVKTSPLIGAGLTLVLCAAYAAVCVLSALKRRLLGPARCALLGEGHASDDEAPAVRYALWSEDLPLKPPRSAAEAGSASPSHATSLQRTSPKR